MLLEDPTYMGLRRERERGPAYDQLREYPLSNLIIVMTCLCLCAFPRLFVCVRVYVCLCTFASVCASARVRILLSCEDYRHQGHRFKDLIIGHEQMTYLGESNGVLAKR